MPKFKIGDRVERKALPVRKRMRSEQPRAERPQAQRAEIPKRLAQGQIRLLGIDTSTYGK